MRLAQPTTPSRPEGQHSPPAIAQRRARSLRKHSANRQHFLVAQAASLLYRRLPTCVALETSHAAGFVRVEPTGSRRYSRQGCLRYNLGGPLTRVCRIFTMEMPAQVVSEMILRLLSRTPN